MRKISKEMKIMKFKIFLSTFGLKLDNYENLDDISTINILKGNEKVGEFNINNDQESLYAHFDSNSLYANFSNVIWKNDWNNYDKNDYYYNSTINFQFLNGFYTNLTGDITFKGIISSEEKNYCRVSSYLKGALTNNSRIVLDIKNLHDISSKLIKSDTKEKIIINPYPDDDAYDDDTDYSFLHLYKKGEHNYEDNSIPYLYYSLLFNYTNNGKNVVEIVEKKGKETLVDKKENILFEKLSKKSILNDINNMNKIDSGIKKGFKNLKEALTIDTIPLFDNLISLSYENYNEKELEETFGIKKKKISDTIPYNNIDEALFKDIDYKELLKKENSKEYKKCK